MEFIDSNVSEMLQNVVVQDDYTRYLLVEQIKSMNKPPKPDIDPLAPYASSYTITSSWRNTPDIGGLEVDLLSKCWTPELEGGNLELLEDLIPGSGDGIIHHQNLADYVLTCWQMHAGIVMRPDMFYFTVFNEIAKYIIANAEECRHIFSDKPVKQDIVIVQDTSQCINLELLIAALKNKIPTCVADLLPDFSTDTPMAKEARLASFAEAASPYYNYITKRRCGIRKVRLEGTVEDWSKIQLALKKWADLLASDEFTPYLEKALEISDRILSDLRSNKMTPEFWSTIVWLVRCGSGHPSSHGWLVDLCGKDQGCAPYDLFGHITRVEWKDSGQKFVVHHGLFSSKLQEKDYLMPEYSRIVFKFPTTDSNI